MDISRNKFSNAMCVLFTSVLLVLFCVCVGRKFGIANMVSRMIITGVYCGVVVGLAFVLNKTVKRFVSDGKRIDGDKAYLASMIVASILLVIVRLMVISDFIKVEFSKGTVYDMAKIGSDGRIYTGMTTVNSMFATLLSAMFKIFGNTYFPVYLTQTLLSVIAYALIVWSVKNIFGRFSSATVAVGMAVLPIFFRNIANDGSDCLLLLLFGIILWVSALYKNSIEQTEVKIVFSLFIGLLTGILALYSTLFMFAIVIPVIVLFNCNSEPTKDRVVNTFCMIFGHIFAFGLILILYSYLVEKSGVEGFVKLLMKHINYRFGFISNPEFILKIGDERGIFLLLILCVFYCVMFWRNEDDTAHIIIPFWVIIFAQMFFINVNNRPAYIMIFALCLLIIGGCGLYGLGSIDSPVRVTRIEDDMQPAEISSIDDKPVSVAAVRLAATENSVQDPDIKESKPDVVIRPQQEEKSEEIKAEPEVKSEDPKTDQKSEELKTEPEIKTQEPMPIKEESTEETGTAELDSNPEEERKYNAPEVRKTSDFGMNDVDFESLFNGDTVPPKAVSKNIYDDVTEEVSDKETGDEGGSEETSDENKEIEGTAADAGVNEGEDVINDISNDQKAYVDSFFGYLYDEPQKQYVSHASNFADLDLDLGIDAFDNLNVETTKQEKEEPEKEVNEPEKDVQKPDDEISKPVAEDNSSLEFNEEPVIDLAQDKPKVSWEDFSIEESVSEPKKEIDNIESEFVFDFDEPAFEYKKGWEPIKSEYTDKANEMEVFKALTEADEAGSKTESNENNFFVEDNESHNEDEFSIEEMLGKKIDEDEEFSYEDALKNKIENEEAQDLIGFSYEDALSKKLDVEEAIEKAKTKEEFSFEDALNEKIVTEESINVADHLGDISYVKAVEQKMTVEDGIKDNLGDEGFSFQEALEQKLDVERSIENAKNDEALAEFAGEELITDADFDFSGNGLNDRFVFEEAKEEQKSDISIETVETFSFDNSEQPVIKEQTEDAVDLIKEEKLEEIETKSEEFTFDDDTSNTMNAAVDSTKEEEKTEEIKLEEAKPDEVKPEEIEFIENPLPLPKKHVHREMDYGRVIPEAWMHYDVEINNTNNKYDI
ncbi:MAG: hypothetical protein ILN61_10200 [Lachnospiraceae bacterium]|nr:hypothetical protein [Lachnospiraceae bacterium]